MEFTLYLWPVWMVLKVFKPIAKNIQNCLIENGYKCYFNEEETWLNYNKNNTIPIIFGVNEYKTIRCTIPDNAIIVNFEQLFDGSNWAYDSYIEILKNHEVWDYDNNNIKWLKKRVYGI